MGIIRPIAGKTEFLQAIGLVSVFHSTLQFELAEVLKVLLRVPSRDARFLVSMMSFKNCCGTIQGLVADRVVPEEIRQELKKLLARAQRADEARNRVLHSEWGVSLGLLFSKEAVRSKPKPGDLDHHEVQSPEDIGKLAEEIRGVVDALASFWPRLQTSLG